MKPQNFCLRPFGSVLQKSEAETVAKNIMRILHRTGNKWRTLSWEEYKSERQKDTEYDIFGFQDAEKIFFDQVVDYCKNPEKAIEFCSDWYFPVKRAPEWTTLGNQKAEL